MKYQELFVQIDALNESYLQTWEDVCNIESPTEDKAGVDAVGRHFAEMARTRGWQVEFARQERAGDAVCITMNPDAAAEAISVSGHMDTVHPVGSFGTPAVRRDGDKLYGPGVTDCKGGIVAAFLAMDALDRCGYRARPIRLLLQSDEENGSTRSKKATIGYICEKAQGSLAFFNMECFHTGRACLQRKGIISFTFTVTGVEAHASKCAVLGANAIAEAAHKILEIEKIKDDEGLTCCCSVISGGTVVNTVPGECKFKVNVRFATAEQQKWICDFMQTIADRVYIEGCRTTVKQTSFRLAMEYAERNEALLNTMNAAYRESGLPELAPCKLAGGSDAADVTAAGIPCIDSIGIAGGEIHSPREFACLASLAEAAKRFGAAVLYMSK